MSRRRVAIFFFLVLLFKLSSAEKQKIWIDTDMLFGKLNKDVDDGLALIIALGSNEVEVVGISLVDEVEYGDKITKQFLEHFSPRDVSVFKGANRPFKVGAKTDAVEGLAGALRKQKLTIVGLGMATNIATTLKLYPYLSDSIERIVLCMGREPDVHFNPGNGKRNLNDYNFDLAPEAMEILLASNIPIVLCGYQASSSVYFNKSDYKFLLEGKTSIGRKIYHRLNSWRFGWQLFFGSKKGFIPFDAVTLAYILKPELIEAKFDIPVEIRTMRNDNNYRNLGTEKKYLLADKNIRSNRNVTFCYASKPDMKEYLLHAIRETFLQSKTTKR